MNTNVIEARTYISKAREALQRGDRESAWLLGKQAAIIAPEMEDAWLVLIASEPNPQVALTYAQKALAINPESKRARRGLEWAYARVKQTGFGKVAVEQTASLSLLRGRKDTVVSLPKHDPRGIIPASQLQINRRNRLYLALLIGAGFLIAGLVGLFALTSPALASIVNNVSAPVSTQEKFWASVDIAKATTTRIDLSAVAPASAPLDATTSLPTDLPTSVPMDVSTLAATESPTGTPEATETPGTMVIEIVDDDLVRQSAPPVDAQTQYPGQGNGERWIDVNLSEQRVYAYQGETVVNSFLVSTGLPQTPTVTGKYQIYVKVRIQDMSGPGYYLPDVPSVMYFYEDYGFHGTYWHNNFGTPMSRGCVNMTVDDAAWLYDWASVGTGVNVHY